VMDPQNTLRVIKESIRLSRVLNDASLQRKGFAALALYEKDPAAAAAPASALWLSINSMAAETLTKKIMYTVRKVVTAVPRKRR